MKNSILIIASMLIGMSSISQNCDCTLSEVENNTVSPCDYTIGTVVTVNTAAEFINAVNQANNTGGNMTILIADGTYQIASTSWYPYITASNVVFRSLSGNRDAVILTGHGMADAGGTEIGIYAIGDNITIANLTIKDVGNHGIAVTGDNLYVYNVKIQNTYEQMIKGNNTTNGIVNGIVKCSLFEYTNGIGPQWYIGGLDIHKGINWTVSDNVFKDISSPSSSLAQHAVHFWNSSSNNVVERNKIVNCDRGIGFGLGTGSPNTGGVIKNNMIFNDGTNIFDDVGIGLESSPNTKVYNNTIYIAYPNAIEYRFAATTNVDITNNITNKLIRSRNGGSATLTTNNTNALTSWFVNTTSGDLRLAANNSTIVDMGTTLADVAIDIDKVARPQFANHDIGASEYPESLSIDGYHKENYITVYPTPSSTSVTLKSFLSGLASVTVYNNLGQKITSFKEVSLLNGFTIDVNNWAAGIYYCSVTASNQYIGTVKMIVAK